MHLAVAALHHYCYNTVTRVSLEEMCGDRNKHTADRAHRCCCTQPLAASSSGDATLLRCCVCFTGALRFGYFYGGDGEVITRMDVRNLAGFIRDGSALITNWLLPLPSAKLELRQEWPVVEEHRTLLPLLM